jgi:hypothetical protein
LAMQGGLRMPKLGRQPLILFCSTILSSIVDGRMDHCPAFVVLGSEIPLHQQPQSVRYLQVTRHWKHPDAPMLHSSPLQVPANFAPYTSLCVNSGVPSTLTSSFSPPFTAMSVTTINVLNTVLDRRCRVFRVQQYRVCTYSKTTKQKGYRNRPNPLHSHSHCARA